jgi:hypothetical protein
VEDLKIEFGSEMGGEARNYELRLIFELRRGHTCNKDVGLPFVVILKPVILDTSA